MKEPVYVNKSEPFGKPGDGQCGGLCACFDSPDGTKKVVTHNPPRFYLKGSFIWIFIDIEKYPYDNRLYNIEDDPGENSPIDTSSELYKKSVPTMLYQLNKQLEKEARINMRCQLQDFWR